MASFSESINKNINKILTHIDEKCYSITWQLFTSIVQLSPSPSNPGEFAKGLLSNQWYPLAGSSFSTEVGTNTSPNGSASLARITALKGSRQFYGKDGVMTMANNTSWAYRAEYLGWPQSEYAGWIHNVPAYRMVAKSLQAVAAQNR